MHFIEFICFMYRSCLKIHNNLHFYLLTSDNIQMVKRLLTFISLETELIIDFEKPVIVFCFYFLIVKVDFSPH